jgi:hypothetical protein
MYVPGRTLVYIKICSWPNIRVHRHMLLANLRHVALPGVGRLSHTFLSLPVLYPMFKYNPACYNFITTPLYLPAYRTLLNLPVINHPHASSIIVTCLHHSSLAPAWPALVSLPLLHAMPPPTRTQLVALAGTPLYLHPFDFLPDV